VLETVSFIDSFSYCVYIPAEYIAHKIYQL